MAAVSAAGQAFEPNGGSLNSKGLNWYVAGNLFREDGWRQFSPSEVRQVFAKLGWTHGKTSAALSFGYADNWLTGMACRTLVSSRSIIPARLQHPRYHLESFAVHQLELAPKRDQ